MSRKKGWFSLLYKAVRGKLFAEQDVRSCKEHAADYQLLRGGGQLNTVVLGDSHAKYGVYPAAFSRYTFNAGEVSADLYTSYHLGRQLLEQYPSIKIMILIYSCFSAGFDLSQSAEKWRCALYSKFLGVPWRNIPFPFKVGLLFLKKSIIPTREANPKGWTEPSWFFPANTPLGPRVAGHMRHYTHYGKKQLSYLYALRDLCAKKKKRFIVVAAPARSDYRQELYRLCAKENINPWEDVEDKTNFEFINAQDWLTDNYFGDFDHLNQAGAVEFSKRLDKLLG